MKRQLQGIVLAGNRHQFLVWIEDNRYDSHDWVPVTSAYDFDRMRGLRLPIIRIGTWQELPLEIRDYAEMIES